MDRTVQSVPAVLLELTDTSGPDFDTAGLLYQLATASVELLDVDAAGVLLLDDHGRLIEVAASHSGTSALEKLQVQIDRGPCVESVRIGEDVLCADLERESRRWPEFGRAARDQGFRAVYAMPLSLRADVVGGLNLFRCSTGVLTDTDRRTAHHLATAAAIGLLHRRAVHQRETRNAQLRLALTSRIVIEQAKGFLAARLGSTPEAAFAVLRSYARSHRERLTDVAQAVVDDRISITWVRDTPPVGAVDIVEPIAQSSDSWGQPGPWP